LVDGIPADQRRALEQADELRRTALRQFVVTHPAFVKVDFLASGRAALRGLPELVDFKRALIVVLLRAPRVRTAQAAAVLAAAPRPLRQVRPTRLLPRPETVLIWRARPESLCR